MKRAAIILLLLGAFVTSSAQNTSQVVLEQEDGVDRLVERYNEKLVMTGKQQLLFKKKLIEFQELGKRIESELNGQEKLDALRDLRKEENAEMAEILTQPQLEVYVRLKPTLQPLDRVNKG